MHQPPPQLPPPLPRHDVPQSTIMIMAVAALGIVGLISITFLVLLAPLDRDVLVLVTVIVGFLSATGAALLGFGKAAEATENVRELHVAVDGRLTKLLEETQMRSAAEATLIERAAGTQTALDVAAATVTAAVTAPDPTTVAAAAVEAARMASRGPSLQTATQATVVAAEATHQAASMADAAAKQVETTP